jgi:crossover junction endodeoxyribonuclease RuvC
MRVMGVDPGLTRCGVAVIEGNVGTALHLRDIGIIGSGTDLPHEQRLLQIVSGLRQRVADFQPDFLAIERVFSQHNVRSVMGTAQVAGLAMVLAAETGIPVTLYTPTEVKAAVTGSGRADKAQVGFMVQRLLTLAQPPKPADAADAAAIAICHIWRGAARDRINQAVAAHR